MKATNYDNNVAKGNDHMNTTEIQWKIVIHN